MVKKSSNPDASYRSFKVEGSSIGFEGGKFISKTPTSAAKKVSRKLFDLIQKSPEFSKYKSDKDVQFIIRESTQGSSHKTYAYEGIKVKLSQPVVRVLPNGSEYTIEFEYKTHALKDKEIDQ